MIEVSIPDRPDSMAPLKRASDAALQLQRRLIRHRHTAAWPAPGGGRAIERWLGHGVIGAACQVDAFRPEIVQRRPWSATGPEHRGGLVHESDPLAAISKQAPLDIAPVKRNAGVGRCQPDRIPGVAHVRVR